jgi:hypothetical protein
MIALPPGCTINYPIRIIVKEFNSEMKEWYEQIGGEVLMGETFHNYYGKPIEQVTVKYGNGRYSYWMQNNTGNVLLHFNSEDANIALMFIIKFVELIKSHNFKDAETYVY